MSGHVPGVFVTAQVSDYREELRSQDRAHARQGFDDPGTLELMAARAESEALYRQFDTTAGPSWSGETAGTGSTAPGARSVPAR